MNRVSLCAAGFALTILFSARAYAQSNSIYFPYFVDTSQVTTELILTNVTGQDAAVTLQNVWRRRRALIWPYSQGQRRQRSLSSSVTLRRQSLAAIFDKDGRILPRPKPRWRLSEGFAVQLGPSSASIGRAPQLISWPVSSRRGRPISVFGVSGRSSR
jgi:hypothetical protein